MATARGSHLMSSIVAAISIVIALGFNPARAQSNGTGPDSVDSAPPPQNGFHQAASDAELALDHIIRLSDHDDSLFLFITKRPDRDKDRDKKYTALFSKELMKRVADVERRFLNKTCNGVYDGEICGLDYNPITCVQDYSDVGYVYRTENTGHGAAVVSLKWPRLPGVVATYRMIRSGNLWIMDGVSCGPNTKFNMK
ncbi:hypothetical protein [Magnetospirillum molischianum]|uniref:DUF3828 domain-containing protein n=1 Tax=Magnetospirillum molischianum DSM 120 TaxID=1150626 RepID=H8FWT7_MAGML|nr:hypothetical protein [Magnetospirillum molischianum]CCG42825.1 conserved exported hypothetical protein [Magnetospirillum molischianum DSM 120]